MLAEWLALPAGRPACVPGWLLGVAGGRTPPCSHKACAPELQQAAEHPACGRRLALLASHAAHHASGQHRHDPVLALLALAILALLALVGCSESTRIAGWAGVNDDGGAFVRAAAAARLRPKGVRPARRRSLHACLMPPGAAQHLASSTPHIRTPPARAASATGWACSACQPLFPPPQTQGALPFPLLFLDRTCPHELVHPDQQVCHKQARQHFSPRRDARRALGGVAALHQQLLVEHPGGKEERARGAGGRSRSRAHRHSMTSTSAASSERCDCSQARP